GRRGSRATRLLLGCLLRCHVDPADRVAVDDQPPPTVGVALNATGHPVAQRLADPFDPQVVRLIDVRVRRQLRQRRGVHGAPPRWGGPIVMAPAPAAPTGRPRATRRGPRAFDGRTMRTLAAAVVTAAIALGPSGFAADALALAVAARAPGGTSQPAGAI